MIEDTLNTFLLQEAFSKYTRPELDGQKHMKWFTNAHKKRLRLFVIILIFWQFASFYNAINIHLIRLAEDAPTGIYNFWISMLSHLMASFIACLVGGVFIVYYARDRFRRFSIIKGMILFALIVSGIILLGQTVGSLVYSSIHFRQWPFHPEVLNSAGRNIFSPATVQIYLFWFLVVNITYLGISVADRYGQTFFQQLVLGKYMRPRREKRVFMFLDLKNSTGLAERMGDQKFSMMIRECFNHLTTPILMYNAQVVSYVGDEVILSWDWTENLDEQPILGLYHDFIKTLKDKEIYFQKKYQTQPLFKAGVAGGEVTVAEMGEIKSELTFLGEALNTASRVQGLCNELGEALLFGGDFGEFLSKKGRPLSEVISSRLKGSNTERKIYACRQSERMVVG